MKIAISGASGFLGSKLVQSFHLAGFDVSILTRTKSDLVRLSEILPFLNRYNVDEYSLHELFSDQQFDIVVHTACTYGRKGESNTDILMSNLIYGVDLLHESKASGVGLFINTDSILPKELNSYSLSKSQFTDWMKKYREGMSIVNLRIDHMYGPGDDEAKFIYWLLDQFKENVGSIPLTEGDQLRDFIYIDDIVEAYKVIVNRTLLGGGYVSYDLVSGTKVTIKNFVKCLFATYQSKFGSSEIKLDFGALPYRRGESMVLGGDPARLCSLGWRPKVDMKLGIKKIIEELA